VITVDTEGLDEVQSLLRAMLERTGNLSPILKAIGETLIESTKERFATSTAPDGSRWKPNSPATIAAWLARHSAKGGWTAEEKKPLIGETRMLSTTITYQVPNPFTVMIGSPMVYAATHQKGRGRIPARPFLGLSTEDRADIVDMIVQFLMEGK
jgi:phage virion morphogenesis protein